MFPGSFEWVWDMGHLIFMGLFWLVIAVLLSGITIVLVKTAGDLKREAEEGDDLWIESAPASGGGNPSK